MAAIAEAYGISSGTVFNHVKKHNKELKQQGECSLCRRVESEYYKTKAKRGTHANLQLERQLLFISPFTQESVNQILSQTRAQDLKNGLFNNCARAS